MYVKISDIISILMFVSHRSGPTTPEAEHINTHTASKMQHIENMTDPDDCHSQAKLLRQPVLPQGIEQTNFGLNLVNTSSISSRR